MRPNDPYLPLPRRRWTPFRIVVGLMVLAGLGWGGYALFFRRPPAPPPAPAAAPTHVMEGLSLNEIQDGVKRWNLEAKSARYLQDRKEIELTGIRLEFFGEGGRVIRVSCREGRVDTQTRALTLTGEVTLSDGEVTVTTGLVRYLPHQRLLLAPEEVTVTTPRLTVQGRDLSIFVAHRRLVLKEHRLTEVRGMEDWRL